MRNLSFVRTILGRFRDLVGSTSTAMKTANPKPSSDAARTTGGSFANLKINTKLKRAIEQINLLGGKLHQVVNGNAKLKVKQTEDSKLWQRLDSEVSSMKTQWTRCDQLTETPQHLARQTEQADEEKQFFEEILSNAEQKIISEKLVKEKTSVKFGLEKHNKLERATEQIDLLEENFQQVVNGNAKLKVKQTEDSKLWQRLDSEVSSMKTQWTHCDQLTETPQQLARQTEQADEDKQFFEEILSNAEQKIISEKLVKEKTPVKIGLEKADTKLERATEQTDLLEGKLQQVVNGNAKLKVNQTEDSKLWLGLDSEASSTKTLCDQLTQTLHHLAREKEQGKQDMFQKKEDKEEMDQSYKPELYPNDTMIKEKDSVIKQLEGSIAMVQHIEVTENKLRRLESEAKISASNINWLGNLPYEDCQGEISKRDRQVETLGNQINISAEQPFQSTAQVEESLAATECQLSEAKKQYDLMLESKKMELSKHLKEPSLKNYQAINEICKKSELEKIEITNAKIEKAAKLLSEMENKHNEKISEKKQDSKRYLMHIKEEHGAMVARIQQDKEHNESTLQDYLKEELQPLQSQAGNELRERLLLLSKEHELQIKSLRMKHEEECQRMQDELELQNSKEEKLRGSLQLQQKVMGENQQVDQEVNSKKVVVKSLCFPFHQFRMISSKSRSSIDEGAPGNTATIILDEYNLPASKRSYRRAINKAREWCKANTKVFDLSEYFGPGAEIFTTPAEGIFHLKIKCAKRELTVFINGRDLYLLGWEGDRHGAIEIQENDGKERERCIPSCTVIKMGLNYHDICKHPLGDVRIGLPAMTHAFHVLYKCDGTSYNDARNAVAILAVNICEAIRDEEICEEVQDSFDLFLDKLDSRWDRNSGRAPLSKNIRTYSFYSSLYLEYVDCMMSKDPLPEIINRGGLNVKSIHELRNRIKVPLRDAYDKGEFVHEKRPESPVWFPPYPNGKGWVSEPEEDEEQLKEEEEEE